MLFNELRHELALAAALRYLGNDVTTIFINETRAVEAPPQIKKVSVEIDHSYTVNLEILQVTKFNDVSCMIKSLSCNAVLFNPLRSYSFLAFLLRNKISNAMRPVMVARVWGVFAAKISDLVSIGASKFLYLKYLPSLAKISTILSLSDIVVALDRYTRDFLHRYRAIHGKEPILLYPSYAKINNRDRYPNQDQIPMLNDYVLSVISVNRAGIQRLVDIKIARDLYLLAKRYSDIEFVVVGSTANELKACLGKSLPKNIVALGTIRCDAILEPLYRNALLVLIPIYYRSVSNRLLEAIYYGKAFVSTSKCRDLHPEIPQILTYSSGKDLPYVFRAVLRRVSEVEDLVKDIYNKYFKALRNAMILENIIRDSL